MRIIIFGCSFSNHHLKGKFKKMGYTCIDKSMGGNSNYKIINDVYNFVKNDYQKGDVLLIQYSFISRFWHPNNLLNDEYGFHSMAFNSPIYYNNKSFQDDLKKFYELYLKLFFNKEKTLEYHLMKIDMLKSFLESNDIKFIHYMWSPNPCFEEIGETDNKKIEVKFSLEKYNFLKFEGYQFLEDFIFKNQYNNAEDDPHYDNTLGSEIVYKILYQTLTKL